MSCRVVTWQMASEYSSASSASTRICVGFIAPNGILTRSMPGASKNVSGPFVSDE